MANPEHELVFRAAERTRDNTINLSGFDLRKMLTSCPRLNGINLSRADLRDSNLSGAHLQGADLREANLSRGVAQLASSWVRSTRNPSTSVEQERTFHFTARRLNVSCADAPGLKHAGPPFGVFSQPCHSRLQITMSTKVA